ncbi:hypothetical protein HYV49_05380 [Candidatus Pacearchaeota archaeon]|nr:hypothetical protein [Candidatus Pacearchaeota archaeon]
MKNLEDKVSDENIVEKLYTWSKNYVNYKIGSIAGLIGGSVVYYINREHGFIPAAGAFGKQFLYNLFIGGFNVKTCEKLATKIKSKSIAIAASTLVPTFQAFAITYSIHKFGGTPEAFDSSIWQVYVNIPICFAFGLIYRKRYENPCKND